MSDIDKDLQRRLRDFADQISPEPGRGRVVVRSARTKRRLVGLSAGLAVVLALGGLAGAATLLGDRDGIRPAPGPEEMSECVSADYDLAVFVPEEDFHDKMVELNDLLKRHDEVASFRFLTAADALQEHLRDKLDDAGSIPTSARRSQYRVTLEAGVDPHRLSDELADLTDGAFVPAPDCVPSEPQQKFARYFFEVAERDASASGVLEVNSEQGTLCYEATTENVQASHLLRNTDVVAGGRRFERMIVVTFFDPDDREQGAALPSGAPICFQEEQLGDLEGDLQALIDHPEDFRVSFHRGPNDEPGLIAKLVPQGTDEPCAMGAAITEITAGTVAPGERVVFAGECFQDLRLHKKTKVLLTATVDEEGRPVAKEDLGKLRTCELIAAPQSKVRIFEGGELRGWLIVPQDGTCFGEQSARTHVPLGAGRYQVAVGCRACTYADLHVDPAATSSSPAGVRALVRSFMQARVTGAGADEFLDDHGRADFRQGGDLAPLYPDPPLQDFQIEFIDDLGDGSYEVGISFIFQQGSYGETLFVRERDGILVISGGRPGLEGP